MLQIISVALVLVVLVLLVRYVWGIFFDSNYKPVAWQHACKEDRVGKELISLERSYPDKVRFFNWWFQVERLKRDGVPGDFAELGVYKGESAKILHLMDPARTFHLYDTFEGFKEEDLKEETGEAASYTTKNFADTSLEAVKRFLGEEGKFVYHVGRFDFIAPTPTLPQLGEGEREGAYALVNLDADLYLPTKAGLEYFYPLLSPGGVIIIHDYNNKWPGIIKAVDEFTATIPENPVMVPDMDGSVMIIKNSV